MKMSVIMVKNSENNNNEIMKWKKVMKMKIMKESINEIWKKMKIMKKMIIMIYR